MPQATMQTALDLFRNRRSLAPHKLLEPGPVGAELDTLLTLASRVPDHGRLTPWRFIVIAGEARHRAGEAIAAAFLADNPAAEPERLAVERGRLAQAPLVVAVVSRAAPHPKIPDWEQVLSAGAVCMNLLHGAHLLGFAASWITGWHAFDRRILDALGLQPHERLAGYIHVGTRGEPADERPRPALASIVTHF